MSRGAIDWSLGIFVFDLLMTEALDECMHASVHPRLYLVSTRRRLSPSYLSGSRE